MQNSKVERQDEITKKQDNTIVPLEEANGTNSESFDEASSSLASITKILVTIRMTYMEYLIQ